jgi:hypothetical protein
MSSIVDMGGAGNIGIVAVGIDRLREARAHAFNLLIAFLL